MDSSKREKLKMSMREECETFIENIHKGECHYEECNKLCSDFVKKHGDVMDRSTFFVLLKELVQESKEQLVKEIQHLKERNEFFDRSLCSLWDIAKKARGRERYRELLENEEIQDYNIDVYWSNDRELQLINNWRKRIYSLAKVYWDGDISREELVKKVDTWNKRKCETQRRIEIGNVLWEIAKLYQHESFPIRCENVVMRK
jgi:hypothetical protein